MIYAIKKSLGRQNIYYKKNISKRWDPRPGNFGRAKDPVPRFNLRVRTQKARVWTVKTRSETQDPRPWSETWGPNLFQRWNLRPATIISISPKNHFFQLICWFFPHRAIYYYNSKICSLKWMRYFLATQPRPQSTFKNIALTPHDFAENFYFIWLVNCKTIGINLCNAWFFNNGWFERSIPRQLI